MDSGSDDDGNSMWSRAFTFGANIQVRVEEEWGLGIGGTVWEGGVLLARYLSSKAFQADAFKGKRCIEIGAGITALPSIATAHCGTLSQIVVTDIDECIEALIENLTANLPQTCRLTTKSPNGRDATLPGDQDESSSTPQEGWELPQSVVQVAAQDFPLQPLASSCAAADQTATALETGPDLANLRLDGAGQETLEGSQPGNGLAEGTSRPCLAGDDPPPHCNGAGGREREAAGGTEVVVSALDWREDAHWLEPPFDLVLVADVVYIEELMEPLLQCMHSLASPDSTVILAYYERSKAAGTAFWRLLPDYFAFEKIPEASYGASKHPDDVGLFLLRRL